MQIITCYILVVIIWSTTPLAISYSSGSVTFIAAVTLRMVGSALFAALICKLFNIKILFDRASVKAYASGAIGAFGGLLCVYWGAQYVPSGLISIMFGLTPIISAVLAALILRESFLTPAKFVAIVISIAGLGVVFYAKSSSQNIALGVCAVLMAVMLFNISTICVKITGKGMHPLGQTTGTLIFSSALYFLVWMLMDGDFPTAINNRNLLAIGYLAICGSVLGFIAYYYILQKMNVVSVGLITLMTPVFAMLLGVFMNNEHVHTRQWVGLAIVIIGLGMFVLSKQRAN